MEKKERVYSMTITESELKNHAIAKALVSVITLKLRNQRKLPYYSVSEVEYLFLTRHYSWTDLGRYSKVKGFKKLPGELGKYNGKRVVLVKLEDKKKKKKK